MDEKQWSMSCARVNEHSAARLYSPKHAVHTFISSNCSLCNFSITLSHIMSFMSIMGFISNSRAALPYKQCWGVTSNCKCNCNLLQLMRQKTCN